MLAFEKTERITQRKAALLAGIALLMTVCAAVAYGVIHNSLVIKGDAVATVRNLSGSLPLFRAEILCWFLILLSDMAVSWALYVYFKQVDHNLSVLGAGLRLFYCAILAIAISNLVYVSLLLSGSNGLASTQIEPLQAQTMLYLDAFQKMWSLGLIIFGFHLFVVGYLVLKSKSIPKILGILLFIASAGYVTIHTLHVFLPQYDGTTALLENILTLPMALGELCFGIWLLFRGGKAPKAAQ